MAKDSITAVEIAFLLENRFPELPISARMIIAEELLGQFYEALQDPRLTPCIARQNDDGSTELSYLVVEGPGRKKRKNR